MKNNKLFSIILALLVCLSMVVSASATNESDLIFALESADSSVEELGSVVVGVGETFTVSVIVEKNPGVHFANVSVSFDAEKLELVDAKVADNVAGVALVESNVAGYQALQLGKFSLPFNVKNAFTSTGVVAELTFKVLEESDAQTSVTLNVDKKNVVNLNGKSSAISVSGDEQNVNVVGENHVCDETKTVEANESAVEPTCTEAGKKADLLCAHCGKLVAEGEEIAALGHTEGEIVVENNVDPTCTEAGSYDNVVYCTVCEAEVSRETVTVDALGHTAGEVVVENKVDPTCTQNGSYDNVTYCTVCSAEVSRETVSIKANGHKAGEKVIENNVNPTCTERGSYDIVAYCTVCKAEVSRSSMSPVALGHSFGDWAITKAPGCSTFGTQARTCANCGLVEEDAFVPATGEHTYGEWAVKTDATVEAEGVEARACSQCGAEETRSIAKLPEPVKNNNTLIIVIVVVAVLAGAGVAAYFVLKNKKK